MVSLEESNGLSCLNCGKPLIGRQRKFCSRGCRHAYWIRRKLHGSSHQEREDKRRLERQRSRERGHKEEDLSEGKTCQNCGRIPCREDFHFLCSRSDHNKDVKQGGQLLPPDYWIPLRQSGEVDTKGCYGCFKLKGTMLNVKTNKTIAICTEWPLQNAPHPSEGCDRPDYSLASPTSKRTQRRRRRKLIIPDGD